MNEPLFPSIDPDVVSNLRRQLAVVTAERDQALADLRLMTMAKNHWRRMALESEQESLS